MNRSNLKAGAEYRRIAVVTVARSDFGHYLPLLRRLQSADWAELQIIAGAAHLCPTHGQTIDWIHREGFHVEAEVPMTLDDDSPSGIAQSMGIGLQGFSAAFERLRPELIVVLGDRFEMHAAACAALPFSIPVAHLHGGEVTEGAIDESLRHSITKLSHLHFTATEAYAARVIRMGEHPDRVIVSGAPGLDHLNDFVPMTIAELESRLQIPLSSPPIAVTFHPETLSTRSPHDQLTPLIEAIADLNHPLVISRPNADPGNKAIAHQWEDFVKQCGDRAVLTANLGTTAYFSLLHHAAAMIGNSSSGIIEAASFTLPVVNIGDRQAGRIRGANVIDVPYCADQIAKAIRRAISVAFHDSIAQLRNPYGDGKAVDRIMNYLQHVTLSPSLVRKPFYDALPIDQSRVA